MNNQKMNMYDEKYYKYTHKKTMLITVLFLALAAVFLFSLTCGSYAVSADDVLRTLFSDDAASKEISQIIWNIRLPRAAAAVICGAALAVAGLAMQTLLGNPLATPFTIGISQGAAFGASFAIVFFGIGSAASLASGIYSGAPYLIALFAFSGSLISTAFILMLSKLRGVDSEGLILSGVALSSFFGACTMLVQYFAPDIQLSAAVLWTFGDPGRAGWPEIIMISFLLIPASAYFVKNSWNYNAISWGDETAAGLGVNVRKKRVAGLIWCSLLAASVTASVGIIGFIGLIAPHLLKKRMGGDHRFLFPAVFAAGALITLAADLISRTIVAPLILPVGIVTAFAGTPLFLYIIVKGRNY
ncbi:MAG: iron ABC transporter permease [Candidatus Wallbacteria bacterium]